MMYYDRRVDERVLGLLAHDGPLGWLLDVVRGDDIVRVDFRREDGDRKWGAIQVYMGRTSPLEVVGRSRGRVKLSAHKEYVAVTPSIFASVSVAKLLSMRTALRGHLRECRSRATHSFVEGEAVSHTGMVRRYGMFFRRGDPLLAVDSEAVIGFRADDSYSTGTAQKEVYLSALRREVPLPEKSQLPRKLDVVGVLPGGDVALVEVKDAKGDILRAVHQAAVHVHRFRALMAQEHYSLGEVINGMVEQKIGVGLLSGDVDLNVRREPKLVPIVAAPETERRWSSTWWERTREFIESTDLLEGIRFWKLSETGAIEDEFEP